MIKLLASTCWGLGLLPKAPGTWGSLFPLFVVLGCGHFGFVTPWLTLILLCLITSSSAATITLHDWYQKRFSDKDPAQVVSDEVAGQSIALLGMAWLVPTDPVTWVGLAITAFILFRILDIWKPSFIGRSQQLKGGVGVLMDDVYAGLIAGVIVLAITLMLH